MPTNQQRRDAAKRKLERQLVRRQERLKTRRQRTIIGSVIAGVVVVAAAIWIITGNRGSDGDTASGDSTAVETTATAPATPCSYPATEQKAVKAVQPPTNTNPALTGTVPATMTLGQGAIAMTLDRSLAPCAVNAFVSLAAQKFYDGTNCHRLTTDENFKILQCGDPSGTGRGGPGFDYTGESNPFLTGDDTGDATGTTTTEATSTDSTGAETTDATTTDATNTGATTTGAETTDATTTDATNTGSATAGTTADGSSGTDTAGTESAEATEATSATATSGEEPAETPEQYPVGTIAMANTTPVNQGGTNGSQFFIVYGESDLGDSGYTKIGTIDAAGVALIEQIAAKGTVAGPNGAKDAPAETVTIQSLTVPEDAVDAAGPEPTTSSESVPAETLPTDTVPTGSTDGTESTDPAGTAGQPTGVTPGAETGDATVDTTQITETPETPDTAASSTGGTQ